MKYNEEAFSKSFTDEKRKVAYLDACKWLASNIISKEDELCEFTFKIKEDKEAELPTFKLILYVTLDEKELRNRHCNICKEAHSAFFINNKVDCNSCNASAYQKRMEDMIKQKRLFLKGKLERVLFDLEEDEQQ